jgi:hypothetical protein
MRLTHIAVSKVVTSSFLGPFPLLVKVAWADCSICIFQIKYRQKLEIMNPSPCRRNLKFGIEKFKDEPIDKDYQRTIEDGIEK